MADILNMANSFITYVLNGSPFTFSTSLSKLQSFFFSLSFVLIVFCLVVCAHNRLDATGSVVHVSL